MLEDAYNRDSFLGEYFFRQIMRRDNRDLFVSVVLDHLNAAKVYV